MYQDSHSPTCSPNAICPHDDVNERALMDNLRVGVNDEHRESSINARLFFFVARIKQPGHLPDIWQARVVPVL